MEQQCGPVFEISTSVKRGRTEVMLSLPPPLPASPKLRPTSLSLPIEMIMHILSFLDGVTLIKIARVNSLWCDLSKDDSLWRSISDSQPQSEAIRLHHVLNETTWRDSGVWFLQCHLIKFADDSDKKGIGCYSFMNGETYYGEWADNKFHGFGICVWSDGRKYHGTFKAGKRSGFGVFVWPSGSRYEGKWDQDVRNGSGKDTWPDSSSYCGEYKNDKFDGRGTFRWEDGGVYVGNWKEDRRHGNGIHRWRDGRIFEGEFLNDRFLGSTQPISQGPSE